jgi:hypothetical protein
LTLRRADYDREALALGIEQLISVHMGEHLPLVNTLTYFFAVSERETRDVLTQEGRARVRQAVETSLVQAFAGPTAPERLFLALHGGHSWHVYQLAWGLDKIRNGQARGKPFAEWDVLGRTLLELAAAEPSIGVPIILTFVTTADRSVKFNQDSGPSSEWEAEFDLKQAEVLFGLHALRQVVTPIVQTHDVELRARWTAAADYLDRSDS